MWRARILAEGRGRVRRRSGEGGRMLPVRAAAPLLACLGLLAPATASAATVAVSGDGVPVFQAASGEVNRVEVLDTFAPLGIRATDGGAPLIAGAGCTAGPPLVCAG